MSPHAAEEPSEPAQEWSFAPPPFNAASAFERLQRDLRQMGLSARAGGFEWRGLPVVMAKVEGSALAVRLAKSPSQHSPQWQDKSLRDHAQVRDFIALTRKSLSAWSDRDD